MPPQTVLIVDSSPLTSRRVEEALAGSGWSVAIASNQNEIDLVLQQESVQRGGIAAVVTSLVYPKGNGYDLCKQVKAHNPAALVFLLCGPFEVYSKERARMVGVTDRIQRPLVSEVFRRHLEGIWGGLPPEAERAGGEAVVGEPSPTSAAESGSRPVVLNVEPNTPPAAVDAVADAGGPESPLRPRPLGVSALDERLATFLPRAYPRPSHEAQVSPELAAATERAIAQVLPEVLPELIEAVLYNALASSPALRQLVTATVEQVVRDQVVAIATQRVHQRLVELEQSGVGPLAPPKQNDPAGG